MSRPLIVNPLPVPPAPSALVAVDRAISELRRGVPVAVQSPDGQRALVLAAEAAVQENLDRLRTLAPSVPLQVAVTGRRAVVLGLQDQQALTAVALINAEPLTPAYVVHLADPLDKSAVPATLSLSSAPLPGWAEGAVVLTKLARLLPASVVVPIADVPSGFLSVDVPDILAYQQNSARSLRRITEARVPLVDSEETRIVAFRPSDGGIEHLAIIIGEPDRDHPVLARLHSECFTGDILGSLRCDCGDQLRGAIAEIAKAGGGVLLYLAQEGRGIGLVNKLRAYQLQDTGLDTLDANLQLGFDDDERVYLPAVQMFRLLGVNKVRLMTNNPAKVQSLARHGVEVTERVPHIFPSNHHNERYLHTKATRSGHLF